MRDPLGYYRNNTVNSRALIECAVKNGVRHFIFSSTAAVYGNPAAIPVTERRAAAANLALRLVEADERNHVARRQPRAWPCAMSFFVTSMSPAPIRKASTGQSNKAATHLIKVAAEAALGLRPKLDVFGIDYPTPDGSCIRDYIHVSDLARAHSDALRHLRSGRPSLTLNCGYGRGFSVLEVIDTVKRVSGVDFKVDIAPRREGDPARIVADSQQARATLGWEPRCDDLSTIVTHALAWERVLMQRRANEQHRGKERTASTPL